MKRFTALLCVCAMTLSLLSFSACGDQGSVTPTHSPTETANSVEPAPTRTPEPTVEPTVAPSVTPPDTPTTEPTVPFATEPSVAPSPTPIPEPVVTPEPTPVPTLEPTPTPEPLPEGYYGDGIYLVGTDIPAGDYYAIPTTSSIGVCTVFADHDLTNCLDTMLFQSFYFFRVYEGEYLNLERCRITAAESAPTILPDTDGYYGWGTYRVGIDIPAGDYFVAPFADGGGNCSLYPNITRRKMVAWIEAPSFFRFEEGTILDARCKFIAADAAPKPEPDANGTYRAGMYRVGIDIPAGIYTFTATKRSPGRIWAHTDLMDIPGNTFELYETFDTSETATLKYGWFLTVEDATFVCNQSFGFSAPIVIGHLVDLTGAGSLIGQENVFAVDSAVTQINANGGIGGRQVEVVLYDSKSDTFDIDYGVKTLVQDEGAIAILGPYQPSQQEIAMEAADQLNIPIHTFVTSVPDDVYTSLLLLIDSTGVVVSSNS